MLKKSPSGSICPYYYKGGELHPLHYGSYRNNLLELSNIIEAEEKFILSSIGGRRIWIDLYETNLTDVMILRLARHLENISSKVAKLALVGCDKKTFKKINYHLMNSECRLAGQIKLFEDPEIAKDWLVGKLHSREGER